MVFFGNREDAVSNKKKEVGPRRKGLKQPAFSRSPCPRPQGKKKRKKYEREHIWPAKHGNNFCKGTFELESGNSFGSVELSKMLTG